MGHYLATDSIRSANAAGRFQYSAPDAGTLPLSSCCSPTCQSRTYACCCATALCKLDSLPAELHGFPAQEAGSTATESPRSPRDRTRSGRAGT